MRVRTLLTLSVLPLAVAPAAYAAEQCSPDCTHPTKACVCAIDSPSAPVAFTPIGDIERQPLNLGQALEIGDEIVSTGSDTLVAVTCPGGTELKFHDAFRVVMLPPESGQDCAVNLLAGGADVMTDERTALASGETLMGSKRTLYGMRVSRDAEGSTVECVVFEGEAEVSNRRVGRTTTIGTSSRAAWRNGVLAQRPTRISEQDVEVATRLYARADLARARAQGVAIDQPERFQATLQARYAAVLTRPGDADARIQLAQLQTTARIARPALYHLARAERLEPAEPEKRVAISATKVKAYEQLGRQREAEVETAKLRRMEVSRLQLADKMERSEERPQPAPAAPSPPPVASERPIPPGALAAARPKRLSVTATASPSVVEVGRPTTIEVKVTWQGGEPVRGAKVVLLSGGGMFRGSNATRVDGATDADGVLRTAWICTQCAPAYVMEVQAIAEGLPPAKTTFEVRVRERP